MENGKLRFNGQIMWRKGENTVQWGVTEVDATTGRLIKSIKKVGFESIVLLAALIAMTAT